LRDGSGLGGVQLGTGAADALSGAIKEEETGGVGAGHDDVGPAVAVEIARGQAINGPLAVTERHGLELLPGAVIEINDSWSLDVADQDFRAAVAIEIYGQHRIRNRLGRVKAKAMGKMAAAIVEVQEAAQPFVTSGDIEMTVSVKIGNGDRARR